ncbi:hypothetical protein Taro_034792 [Colocasia esculenta]|uniref:Uncharacterized protein n=1 Tax=Colocasia esculenta TaxID=4460 RepID=A0A843VXB7_COLES|nr:hypothetical protein [Colocasia esculenta]
MPGLWSEHPRVRHWKGLAGDQCRLPLDVQLKQRSEGVQDRRHRPPRYNTSTRRNLELTAWLTENLGHPTGEGLSTICG